MAIATDDIRRLERITIPAHVWHGRLRRRLDSVSLKSPATIVGVSIIIMAVATLVVVIKGIGWLESAGADQQQWAEVEARVYQIGDIATSRFPGVVDTAVGAAVPGTVLDDRDLEEHVESLIASAEAFAGADVFEELDTSLPRVT